MLPTYIMPFVLNDAMEVRFVRYLFKVVHLKESASLKTTP